MIRIYKWNKLIPLYLKLHEYISTRPNEFINYNYWVQYYNYRRELEQKWNLKEIDDISMKIIPKFGGGSTFDKCENAQNMKIFERWKICKNDQLYKKTIQAYPELMKISQNLFNFYPEF